MQKIYQTTIYSQPTKKSELFVILVSNKNVIGTGIMAIKLKFSVIVLEWQCTEVNGNFNFDVTLREISFGGHWDGNLQQCIKYNFVIVALCLYAIF